MTADQRPGKGVDQSDSTTNPELRLSPEIRTRLNAAQEQFRRVDYVLSQVGIEDAIGVIVPKNKHQWHVMRTQEGEEKKLQIVSDQNGDFNLPEISVELTIGLARNRINIVDGIVRDVTVVPIDLTVDEVIDEVEFHLDNLGFPKTEEINKKSETENKKAEPEWDPDLAFGYTDPPR